MVLRKRGEARLGEDVEDLRRWLKDLPDTPFPVDETVVLRCSGHGDEQPTWAYVEADPAAGVARRRCLACAASVDVLDSGDSWTFPAMWACLGCSGSIAEVAAGLSLPDGERVRWVVLGARCVDCGRLAGLTDVAVDDVALPQVLAGL